MNLALRATVLALSLVVALSGLPLHPAYASAERIDGLPDRPMTLRRVLERDLGDGQRLVVTREWTCRFERTGRLIRVEAETGAVTVEAPPSLAPLAAIERTREVSGLFPATLDAQGRFVLSEETSDTPALQDAETAALSMMRKARTSPQEREDARQFLTRIGATAAEMVSVVPTDLFFPQTRSSHEESELPLPGEAMGRIVVNIDVHTQQGTGLLESLERRITTHVGDSERVAREVWTLQ